MADCIKLLLILPEYPPTFGGMQTHAVHLSRHLQSRGYTIEVLTCRAEGEPQLQAGQEHDQAQGFVVHRRLSRVAHWFNVQQAIEVGRAFHPDLVYASNVYYGEVGRALGVPVVCRSVGNDVMRPWIAYPFRCGSRLLGGAWLDGALYRQFQRWNAPEWIERILREQRRRVMTDAARASACILANSEYTAALLAALDLPRQVVRVLPGGVDSARFAPAAKVPPPDQAFPRLLTACRLVPKKGLDFLIEQMPEIRMRYPRVRLDIIGDGRERRRCEALIRQLGLEDCVHLLGRLQQESLPEHYWRASIFILASRVTCNRVSGLRDAETMGRVLCEANAAGVPVLAACSGGIPSVITHEHNGLLFREEDAEDFLRQLGRLLEDPSLAERLRQAGLQQAQACFDWRVVVGEHERIFRQLLEA